MVSSVDSLSIVCTYIISAYKVAEEPGDGEEGDPRWYWYQHVHPLLEFIVGLRERSEEST